MLGVTLVSLWLRVRSPMWLVDAPNDDGLFARLAGHLLDGEWLGPYNELTLAKGPGYPLFMAVAYRLHLPLKLAEHGVHLLACAVMGVAVWRVFRSRAAGMATYVALALNPAYLGATAARIGRDAYYGSLGLLLAGGIVLVVASVPDLAARGPRWAVPAAVVAGPAVGVVAAGYYLTREERIWLMPALAVAVLACVVGWPRRRRLTVANGLVLGAFTVLAGATGAVAVGWTASQNEQAYGTSVTADLADGEIARAYREWQRVEAGRERQFVTVSEAQRQAVYRVSPAAAEMAGAFSTEAADWVGLGCGWVGVCDDFGPFFVWAMREAGTVSGHGGSGAESQHYFGQVADDIARACDTGALRCTARPIGPMPPLNRIDGGELNRSTWRMAGAFLAYNVGEPERPPSGGGGSGLLAPADPPPARRGQRGRLHRVRGRPAAPPGGGGRPHRPLPVGHADRGRGGPRRPRGRGRHPEGPPQLGSPAAGGGHARRRRRPAPADRPHRRHRLAGRQAVQLHPPGHRFPGAVRAARQLDARPRPARPSCPPRTAPPQPATYAP